MIVIIYDRFARPEGCGRAFELRPDLALLNRPYFDLLAEEYRRIGARQVLWAGPRLAAAKLGPSPTRDTAPRRGETVLISDIHLWPGSETRRAARAHKRSRAGLRAFARAARGNGYMEVIERGGEQCPAPTPKSECLWVGAGHCSPPSAEACSVTRCYPETAAPKRGELLAALFACTRRLGETWRELLGALCSDDDARVLAIASRAGQKVEGHPFWIDSPEQYLLLVDRIMTTRGSPAPQARAIGDGVWVMPGASLEPGCVVEGPVLFGRDCRIGRGTHVIGPAVLGDDAQVGENSFVGGSVLLKGTVLPSNFRVWQSVLAPGEGLEEGGSVLYAWMNRQSSWLPTAVQAEFDSVAVPSTRALLLKNPRLFSALKRGIDIAGALVGLAITLPMYPFIAAAIKLESRGPVFFVHRRQTIGGKEFGCVKFRTMQPDTHLLQLKLANEVDGPQFYIRDDPRVTRVGRLLRRTRLDETPQFWNVLLGDMSLVGPRPSPHGENQYCPAWREARLSVRAGLTGLWQTQGSPDRSAGGFHEWIHYDGQYLRHYSFKTDLKVLWDTLGRLVK